MKIISILDTSICSSNLGDRIIMDAITNVMEDIFDNILTIHIQTHDVISKTSYQYMRGSELKLLGGTNLLSSNMNWYNQWKVSLWDSMFVKNIILCGVGWWQYQNKPNLYTQILYKNLLDKNYLHSVRDSYTEQKLNSIGVKNVINTSCPTMWKLTEEHCRSIPQERADSVLVTFTEYNQHPDFDSKLVNLLEKEYKQIYFWTQQPKDYEYMRSICSDKVIYLQPSLKGLDRCLSENKVDYLGTRLHAGVRALQHKKRTLILSVDNRATEIAKNTNLPVIERDNLIAIASWINSKYETKIKLPLQNINQWKNQFLNT